ncbi:MULTISPECIES: hypothetical protein [unclassified Rhizobium]|uniref:hypothetical protein n=1 Tax=unclassified Rhizobium TaxID=2613769 RepID=UPI0007151B06|nr:MULTISPECIES: hypothetical protein [unclassified Rhizobium]KQS95839.1 hypothetical protein ASG42_28890 [Rhizobium sp. Leaf391]KQS99056.1 hypothetical protein ASG50_20285 [Rhizobium sp. Leaf386]KQT91913.1 hypothetical protein ASG68_19075 [Rhizobium sp. Leaf453]
MKFAELLQRRRQLSLPGYKTLADVGFDGDNWISPYQTISNSKTGPVLVAYNWLDAPSVLQHRQILAKLGYLPGIPFNQVMDLALEYAGLSRPDIYVTQAFHLLPTTRSEGIPQRYVDYSFEHVTRHEIENRKVIALGTAAMAACRRHGVKATEVCHPSSRTGSYQDRAKVIGDALKDANKVYIKVTL